MHEEQLALPAKRAQHSQGAHRLRPCGSGVLSIIGNADIGVKQSSCRDVQCRWYCEWYCESRTSLTMLLWSSVRRAFMIRTMAASICGLRSSSTCSADRNS